MRDLAIAYGNNRQAKKWVNKTISYDDLKARLKVTIRTTESAEEYAKMSRAQRDIAKDHGGFVGGVLRGGRRKVDTVELRSMIALDGDRIDKAFLDDIKRLFNKKSLKLPMVLDSPKNAEMDYDKEQALIEYILDNSLNYTQLIFSSIGFERRKFEFEGEIKIIELKNDKYQLLDSETFKKYENVLENVLNAQFIK